MEVLFTFLYILLFIVCLSTLIAIHELGHLAMAKAFKVYCFEYAIGFGPKIFSKKRKNGETAFSLRAIPFGGFVSMYGEDTQELPEGLVIPEERSLEGIKKWKKSIILVAGVTMNAILALFIFLLTNLCFEQTKYFFDPITVSETSKVSEVLHTGDKINLETHKEGDEEVATIISGYYVLTRTGSITYTDATHDDNVVVLLNPKIQAMDKLDWSYFLNYATVDENDKVVKSYVPAENIVSVSFTLSASEKGQEEKFDVPVTLNTYVQEGKYYFESPGISITKYNYWLGWEAFPKTFEDFGNSATAIVRAFGSLFTSQEARDSTGGIIAIGFETTEILKNFGVDSFLRVWAMISVNLAIVNILPFPGLDGWQLLVTIVEGTTKKKIPDKVKTIVSLVGLALLFGLMILLVFKDVFKYII